MQKAQSHTRRLSSTSQGPSTLIIVAAFAAVYLIWGSTYLAIRYAIESIPPFLMASTRFLVAGGGLYIWSRIRGDGRPTATHWRSAAVVGALLLLGGNGGVVWAERSLPSGVTALLVASEPLWIVMLNWIRTGARPTGRTFMGLFVGIIGVCLLLGNVHVLSATRNADIASALIVLGAAFSWALGSLYSLKARVPGSFLLGAGMQMLCGGALLFLAGTISGEWSGFHLAQASARSVYALLYLIVFGSVIAFSAYSFLLRVASPARASTYAYVNPVVAVLLGWAVAAEPLSWRIAIAAGVIIASVVVISLGSGSDRNENRTEAEQEPASWQSLSAFEVSENLKSL